MWTIYYNVTVFFTFKTPNIGAMPGYVAMFLALETFIFVICHHAVGVLQTLDKYSDCSCIIGEVTPFSCCIELVYKCC